MERFTRSSFHECDPDDFAPQFIELPSQHFKTASMLAKKLHFLPITALVFSISGQPWIHHYIQARRDLGLQISGKLSLPFLPTRIDTSLSHEPVTSSQITKLLREIFASDSLRSHSLKHTCLSFAAKRGFDPHVRKLLGLSSWSSWSYLSYIQQRSSCRTSASIEISYHWNTVGTIYSWCYTFWLLTWIFISSRYNIEFHHIWTISFS